MNKDDWLYLAKLVGLFVATIAVLYFVLTLILQIQIMGDRCSDAGGHLDRGLRCVQVIENY